MERNPGQTHSPPVPGAIDRPRGLADIEFSILHPADDTSFDAMYGICQRAIAASELKPREVMRAMVGRGGNQFVLAQQDAAVVGVAVMVALRTRPIALLDYLAVDEPQRGRGVGAALFSEAIRTAGVLPVLLEVESDQYPGEDQPLREKRVAFYRRLGCRRVQGLDYALPLEVAGTPPPMHLLIHAIPPREFITSLELGEWLTAVFKEVYCKPAGDPRLERMLAGLPEVIELQ